MQATVVVSACILRDGALLMVQEGKKEVRGMWGLPGGRVEPGESLTEAVRREVMEETGLDVTIVGMTRVLRYINAFGYHCVRFNFLCEPRGGELRTDGAEILDARWMTHDEIDAIDDGLIRTPAIARLIVEDVRSRRHLPVDVVLDATGF